MLVDAGDGSKLMFRVKPTTKFEKIIQTWCDRKHLDPNSLKFTFDGRICASQWCPYDLAMEDVDQIDVFMEQVGGHAR